MIIRGMRSLSQGYTQNFLQLSDTEENLSSCVMLESNGESAMAETVDEWPDSVALEASLSADMISSIVSAERIDNGCTLGRMNFYRNPKIDTKSSVKEANFCCEKLKIKFENAGSFSMNNEKQNFVGRKFGHFEAQLPSEYIFEKDFLTETADIIEKYSITKDICMEYKGAFVQGRFYAYGGFFKYGVHPKQMEACVCRIVQDGREMSLRISPISELLSSGIDIFKEHISYNGKKFIGVSNFSASQKMSLYDELKNGACSIKIENTMTHENTTYVSNMVSSISGTNIITINFIKE